MAKNVKKWYESRTIWANVIALGASLGAVFGLDISADQQAAIVGGAVTVVNIVMRFKTDSAIEQ